MNTSYEDDILDLGSPLRFKVSKIRLPSQASDEDLSALKFRFVLKDTLDTDTDLINVTSEDDASAFVLANNALYIRALTGAESLSLESSITASEKEIYINQKRLIGYVYLTLSFFDDDIGPENILHLKLGVLKPAL